MANEDASAATYADWTGKTIRELGFTFQLQHIRREDLANAIRDANEDPEVNGIMTYWPVFPTKSEDSRLQQTVKHEKDVEGFSATYMRNLYSNVRYFDPPQNQIKSILPCTPLALVKTLEYLGIYNSILDRGSRLYGKTITIVNRSEIVGRPLAALCANDGATVYSVDVLDIRKYTRDRLKLSSHRFETVNTTVEQIAAQSDVVVCGVPDSLYKFPSHYMKDGAVAINFSSAKNFDKEVVKEHASIYVPSVGKVTILMLLRNLLRLTENQRNQLAKDEEQDNVEEAGVRMSI